MFLEKKSGQLECIALWEALFHVFCGIQHIGRSSMNENYTKSMYTSLNSMHTIYCSVAIVKVHYSKHGQIGTAHTCWQRYGVKNKFIQFRNSFWQAANYSMLSHRHVAINCRPCQPSLPPLPFSLYVPIYEPLCFLAHSGAPPLWQMK